MFFNIYQLKTLNTYQKLKFTYLVFKLPKKLPTTDKNFKNHGF